VDESYKEWKQNVTGFKMGFIRHPEFELFSNNSVHWKAGVFLWPTVICLPRVGVNEISDHRVMSPLKNDMKGMRTVSH